MEKRLELHEKFCEILGSRQVYFQPPETIKIKYPCIIYQRRTGDTEFADNWPYRFVPCYDVMVIDRDPDSDLKRKIGLGFQMCREDRHYTQDNLNFDTFVIYY